MRPFESWEQQAGRECFVMTLVRAGGSLRSSRAIERRRSPRRIPAPDEPSSRIRLRAGREFVTVDISSTGLLAEGETRLLPGTHVDVHLVTRDGRLLVRSRVVRAFVCHVSHHEIRYRGALAFDHPDLPPAGIEPLRHYASWQVLARKGYAPEVDRCVTCGSRVASDPAFAVAEGGVVCPRCGPGRPRLSRSEYGALQLFVHGDGGLAAAWRR